MGWAAGFRAGSQVAGEALDTYRQGVLARDIKAAQALSPEEIRAPAATQAQVDAATAETNAMAAQDAQDFGLEQPMQYRAPQVGQATAPSRFKLGNQTLDTAPTEQQIAGVRRRAMVDAMTRFDPVQGMRMGMELERDDRERTRFNNEQSDRDTAKALERSRREYYKSLSGIKDGNQLAEMLGGSFSTDGSGVNAMLTFDEKSNKFLFASRVPGMPSRQLDRAELINMAMGVWEQGNGDFNRGMQMVLDGVREQRRLGEADRADAAKIAEGNAGLFWKDRNYSLDKDKYNLEDWYKRQQVGLDSRRVDIDQQRADQTGAYYKALADARGQGKPAPEWEKLPEDGTRVRDQAGNILEFSGGRPVLPGGAATPEQFGVLSSRAGVNQNLLEWGRRNGVTVHPYGRHLVYNNLKYDLADKDDVKEFNELMNRLSSAEVGIREAEAAARRGGVSPMGFANANAAATNRAVLQNIRENTER